MPLFSVAPPEYRKLLVMLRHLRRDESLAANWLHNRGHLVPPGVEIWELYADTGEGACLLGSDENVPNSGNHRATQTA